MARAERNPRRGALPRPGRGTGVVGNLDRAPVVVARSARRRSGDESRARYGRARRRLRPGLFVGRPIPSHGHRFLLVRRRSSVVLLAAYASPRLPMLCCSSSPRFCGFPVAALRALPPHTVESSPHASVAAARELPTSCLVFSTASCAHLARYGYSKRRLPTSIGSVRGDAVSEPHDDVFLDTAAHVSLFTGLLPPDTVRPRGDRRRHARRRSPCSRFPSAAHQPATRREPSSQLLPVVPPGASRSVRQPTLDRRSATLSAAAAAGPGAFPDTGSGNPSSAGFRHPICVPRRTDEALEVL